MGLSTTGLAGRRGRLDGALISALPRVLVRRRVSVWDDGTPIRSELFGVERLEQHARSLAAAQTITARQVRGAPLARRLAGNEAVLLAAYRDVAAALAAGEAITPAAAWLIDNFHIVERQIREIRADLPAGYYRQLPKLAGGPFADYPRVFGLAWAYVAHTDSLFDREVLRRYLRAYQEVEPLMIGELWAVAITLRIVLVENLRRIARRVVDSRAGRNQADALADRLLGVGRDAAEPPEDTLPPVPRNGFPDSFLVQLVHRLRDQDPSVAPALAWLDDQLARQGVTAESVVRDEHQRQVAGSITVRNIVTSMRMVSEVDWTDLVESVSLVDGVLAACSRFRDMDFPTRNLYRTAVEQLARGCVYSELEVAHAAIAAAEPALAGDLAGADPRQADPGYFLIAGGRAGFEAEIGFKVPARTWPGRAYRSLGIGGYVGAGATVAALLLAVPLGVIAGLGVGPGWLAVLALIGAVPAVDLAVAIVNFAVTRGFRAVLLPALDLRGGVPESLRTLVAVPMLLTTVEEIEAQVERLEVHCLSSPPGELHFALLSDWRDAPSEKAEGDEALLEAAKSGVERLNQRYGPASAGPRFLLLHRQRVWNSGEGAWIGWERKRGKLLELNRLLRGERDTTFLDPPEPPSGVRYVITLDADTRLPRETVGRLIGKMAHPLNRPRLDDRQGRVVEGYAILQPRVTPALPVGHQGSLFLRVFSSASGIDPYAAAVSDVYQDLFGEGTYTGKGIYDVDAFQAAMRGRVPESTLLSHDLFEGVFARAGLASAVEVVEDFPSRYDSAALRHHRWARGDWQLLPWILGDGPRTSTDTSRGSMPAIGRWKMLDNIRRSLSSPSLVAALLVGFALPFDAAAAWTSFLVCVMAIPPLIPVLGDIIPRRPDVAIASHIRAFGQELRLALVQSGLMIVFLGHQAWLMADAIIRTLWRVYVSHRHLLEWTPAAQAAFGSRMSLRRFYGRMSGALVLGALALAIAVLRGRGSAPLAALFAAAWWASPAIAFLASLSPRTLVRRPIEEADRRHLRLIARRTWRYFEEFVTGEQHMLPPDNFQEDPQPATARRTSPTNIGLYLLSVAAAREFGWIGAADAVERLEATFATLADMAKHRGHFFNWYDTGDLRPLDPQYVSSVDSGNLAGHLIAVANACRSWREAPPSDHRPLSGVADALEVTRQEALRHQDVRGPQGIACRRLKEELDRLSAALEAARIGPGWAVRLPIVAQQASIVVDVAADIALESEHGPDADLRFWAHSILGCVESHLRDLDASFQAGLQVRLEALEETARSIALAMDFKFLLDPDRLLLSIGYRASDGALDPSCYDLLASEARLASFVAIAKGDAPARHWFRLSHAVTPADHGAALISWSGSMFEYLMPSLVMRGPAESLLEQTNQAVVRRQIEYGASLRIPWGVSEAAYNARDLEFTYQYSNFGVPGLGLKRGLAESRVVAPYATALASMVAPEPAVRNFEHLESLGARGRYGLYESLDFTPDRVLEGERMAIVRAFMAHHQGMTIVSIADTLLDGVLRDYFHAEPIIRATELLLQERAPRDLTATLPMLSEAPASRTREPEGPAAWRRAIPWSAAPATQLLSNGHYTVMITAAGSGFSTWRDQALTRWREDATCDDWGSYVYLRDVSSGAIWSPTYQPIDEDSQNYEAIFNEDHAHFSRLDQSLTTSLEVVVSAEDDAEVRRLTLSNMGDRTREIEATSYAELVLGPQAADAAHPAFSKMFVETEHLGGLGALLATRRRQSPTDPEIWAAHLVVSDGAAVLKREFETDRARFVGRSSDIRSPAALKGQPLSGTTGTVLDPVFALRRRLRIAPGATVHIDFWTMAAGSRQDVLDLVDKHHDIGAFERAKASAWTQVQVQLHHLGIDRVQAGLYQRLAGHLMYVTPVLRPPPEALASGRGSQSGLWPMGISGDLPIILVRLSNSEQLGLVRDALQAIEYWRMKRLGVDLVILNERTASYVQDLQAEMETLVRTSQSRPEGAADQPPGHIFILRADLVSPESQALLTSVARVVLLGDRGSLAEQLERAPEPAPARRARARKPQLASELQVARPEAGIEFFNGLGGFADDGREYVTILGPGQTTPAPWINVVANPDFGFHSSAEGAGFVWSVNSREHQLTPWSNDPVTDRPGSVIYLRNIDTNEVWTPTALPLRDQSATYIARHGFGYCRFEHASRGVAASLLELVPLADPVKISQLTLRNTSGRTMRLSVTAYAEWVLGASRAAAASFVESRIDAQTGAMFATNAWNQAFASRVAFADLAGRQSSWTADRREFLGRNGSLGSPAALIDGAPLSRRTGPGLDPCAALRMSITLAPGAQGEVIFLFGDAEDEAHARALISRYREIRPEAVLADVGAFWSHIVGTVQVKTPDRSMDIMLGGWLLYQTLACRMWARTAFYQPSGAYGFRDQLQDSMAFAAVRPSLAREQLVRAAGRQFVEGDVQHWWLPHSGQGVRTRISDDRVWLAFALVHYLIVTGDDAVLEEMAPFLAGPALEPNQADNFFLPSASDQSGSLFEHAARALDISLAVGVHGLPLIGGGDWSDGLNRVGQDGRGESLWLGWLLLATLAPFAYLAEGRGDLERARRWRSHDVALRAAIEKEGWDGEWYRRAWFDDGAVIGSASNEECRIDSIAQSWGVISGAAPRDRALRAMAAVERELILPQDGLALLFTPPFDRTPLDPGYIKGYPPGLRENGGQYTHAALWSVFAYAALGEGEKAAALFSLLNPINHARTRTDLHRYKVEPYVVAADVYSAPGHVGRGGWTWYTGSAGWMHRAGVESILGLHIERGGLRLDPCIPASWPHFEMTVRHGSSSYAIVVENPLGVQRGIAAATLDDQPIAVRPVSFPLSDDGMTHTLHVRMG